MAKNRIFYVDDVNGSDVNLGFTPEAAWKSVEKVNSQILQPGDVIRFRRGGKWIGMLHPTGSGAKYAPITIEAYGEGDKPLIQGDGAKAAILLEGVEYYVVDGIQVTNHAEERAIRYGIGIIGKEQGITRSITVQNCEVYDVTGDNRRSLGSYRAMYWNGGIYASVPGRSSDKDHLHGILLMNNYIHDVLTSGIRIHQNEDSINDIHHTNVVVRGNRIERTGSDGVIVANCISPLITRNVCYDAGALGTVEETIVIAGIWVCACENALIEYNEVARTRYFQGDGTAFDTDWGTAGDTIFQYNYSHDNEGGFWLDCIGLRRNIECGKSILRYNISLNEEKYITSLDFNMPTEFYGNYFGGTGKTPDICGYHDAQGVHEGLGHYFTRNVFDFDEAPGRGWQESQYLGNWYGDIADLPDDPQAQAGVPFDLQALHENKGTSPEGVEWCQKCWQPLTYLVEAAYQKQN